MVLIIIGIICLIIGIINLYQRKSKLSEVVEMSSLGLEPIQSVIDQINFVKDEIGQPGTFYKQIEFNGIITSDSFINSELTYSNCVYYTIKSDERFEKTYYIQNKSRRERHTRMGMKNIRNESHWIDFFVSDGINKVKINPANCKEIDTIVSLDNYEPYNKTSGKDYRILGYQNKETILPINSKVYITGEIRSDVDGIVIKAPINSKAPFIISLKAKDEVIKQKNSKANLFLISSILFFVLSISFIIAGILNPNYTFK